MWALFTSGQEQTTAATYAPLSSKAYAIMSRGAITMAEPWGVGGGLIDAQLCTNAAGYAP